MKGIIVVIGLLPPWISSVRRSFNRTEVHVACTQSNLGIDRVDCCSPELRAQIVFFRAMSKSAVRSAKSFQGLIR